MSTSRWMVATRCTDPAREDEFNRWYDEVHVPDILTVPHVVAAQRYKLALTDPRMPGAWDAEGGPRYLAVYELDTDDPETVLRTVTDELGPRIRAAGRMIDCIGGNFSAFFTPLGVRQQAPAVTTAG